MALTTGAAALGRRGLPQLVSCSLLQQLRGVAAAAGTDAAQQSAAAAAAAESAPDVSTADRPAVKMNLCTAVNDALHIAMASDPKWVQEWGLLNWSVYALPLDVLLSDGNSSLFQQERLLPHPLCALLPPHGMCTAM